MEEYWKSILQLALAVVSIGAAVAEQNKDQAKKAEEKKKNRNFIFLCLSGILFLSAIDIYSKLKDAENERKQMEKSLSLQDSTAKSIQKMLTPLFPFDLDVVVESNFDNPEMKPLVEHFKKFKSLFERNLISNRYDYSIYMYEDNQKKIKKIDMYASELDSLFDANPKMQTSIYLDNPVFLFSKKYNPTIAGNYAGGYMESQFFRSRSGKKRVGLVVNFDKEIFEWTISYSDIIKRNLSMNVDIMGFNELTDYYISVSHKAFFNNKPRYIVISSPDNTSLSYQIKINPWHLKEYKGEKKYVRKISSNDLLR